jgi:hypothetical protein
VTHFLEAGPLQGTDLTSIAGDAPVPEGRKVGQDGHWKVHSEILIITLLNFIE